MAISLVTIGNDGALITGGNNQASNAFNLLGGMYGLACAATFSSTNVTLQVQGPDGSTWITIQTFSANGYAAIDLPPGSYRANGTSTAYNLAVQRIKL